MYPLEVPLEVRKTIESEPHCNGCYYKIGMGKPTNHDYVSSRIAPYNQLENRKTALVANTNAVFLFVCPLSDWPALFDNIRGKIRKFSKVFTKLSGKLFCFFIIGFLI